MDHRFELKQQMHLPDMNKLWGWFIFLGQDMEPRRYSTYDLWCWWAVAGKGISISRKKHYRPNLSYLEQEKTKNGYLPISKEQLLEIWPTFMEDLNNRVVYEMLVNNNG